MLKELPEGFNLYREHFMFGRADGYLRIQNDGTKEYLFKTHGFPEINGKYVTGKELYDHLKETWAPIKQEESNYYCYRMQELESLRPPKEAVAAKRMDRWGYDI